MEGNLSYRRWLPHLRSPGKIYHVRFSVDPGFRRFTEDWMFELTEYSILYHHKIKSLVFAYVIMPNHAHLVIQPLPQAGNLRRFYRLEDIMRNLKGYSGWMINQRLKRHGEVWMGESFDRIIRGDKDLDNVIDYVHHNPVRWRLVARPQQYRWSSAHTIYSGDAKYARWFELDVARA